MSRWNRASPSPGRSSSTAGSSSTWNTRSALASATAITAGKLEIVLSGEVSRRAAIRKTMIASGASGAPKPRKAGPLAAQMIRITRKPEKTSVSGLVREEYRWVRITCFR
jgi:hypothetical protein